VTGLRVQRLTAVAGLLAVAVLFVGWLFIPSDPPGPAATAEQVVRWTLDDRRALLVGTVLVAAGVGLAIVFFAGLRSLCARAEGPPGLFATVGWGATLVALAVVFVALAIAQTQSYLVLDGDPATVEAFHEARLLLTDLAGLPAAVGLLAFGIAMLRTGFPVKWLGALAGLAAAAQVVGVVALSRQGFFSPSGGAPLLGAAGVGIWITAVSVVLLARPAEGRPGSA
jgi:hypothetical protein